VVPRGRIRVGNAPPSVATDADRVLTALVALASQAHAKLSSGVESSPQALSNIVANTKTRVARVEFMELLFSVARTGGDDAATCRQREAS
jgi:hypothetical protein